MTEHEIMKDDGTQLHGIIVTHPDGDHMNGIKKLLEKHIQKILNKCDIIITNAFYWESRDKQCEEFTKLIESAYPTRDDAVKCLRPGLNCYFPTEAGILFRCSTKHDDVKVRPIQQSNAFPKPKGVDTNETSILTVINESEKKCDIVLTGDSTTKQILPLVEGKEVRIFQVPHHGSSCNSRLEDSQKVQEYSGRYDLSTIGDKELKQTLLFYTTFRAKCYLISAGGTENYKHPHPQVLQGIILANKLQQKEFQTNALQHQEFLTDEQQHQKCVILLTNSRGLHSKKLGQLHQLAPQWTQYVKIYHYDDVFLTEQCHTTLHPETCISDVDTNMVGVEWTPEGYINRMKIMLPIMPTVSETRPLEKNPNLWINQQ